jgi:methylitaconate Delta-isomerase
MTAKGSVPIECTMMRGGTSKAVFLSPEVLPEPGTERDRIVMSILGSGDPRQIDGLGGADVLTSKVAIVGPSSRPDVDVDYTFGQVGIGESTIDWNGNCGNISSAVGVYAIEEGYAEAKDPSTEVVVLNTNTNAILRLIVPTEDGRPKMTGDYVISGVPGSGAEIRLDFAATAGATTGRMLPTGSARDELEVDVGTKLSLEVSLVDVAKLAVFFKAVDIGLDGTEPPHAFTPDVLAKFQAIQLAASELVDLEPERGLPRPVAVAGPKSFMPFNDPERVIAENEVDLLGRWVVVPPPSLHKAFAGTGAVCTGVAARLAGTIVNELANDGGSLVRIGHPSGVFPVRIETDGVRVTEASFSRTARRLMHGTAYV